MDKPKKVSVIMCIYNCAQTLPESIESILAQTYPHWEFIICDDGSSDNTYEVAKSYADRYPEKIKLLKSEKNQGGSFARNKCLKIADGDYFAIHDGDDYSLPTRFEKQVAYLENHPDIAIVGSNKIHFDDSGEWGRSNAQPKPSKQALIKGTPFGHPTCMIRRSAMQDVNGYSELPRVTRVEDYHLWVRMYSKGYMGANISEPLYMYRDDQSTHSKRKFRYRINESYVRWIAFRNLKLPLSSMIHIFRPILAGLMPKPVYMHFHKSKFIEK